MPQDKSTQTKLSKAETEFSQARARLLDARAVQKSSQRRDKKKWDDRRKILAGACVLKVVQTDAAFAADFFARLDAFLIRRDERAVFPELQTPDG